ncbi:MAG: hypothetical protein AAFP02_05750, partial [Bacteroidota bacterium]
LRDISEYNAVMETYLDNLNPIGWRDRLYAEMDSLIEIRESFAGLGNKNLRATSEEACQGEKREKKKFIHSDCFPSKRSA